MFQILLCLNTSHHKCIDSILADFVDTSLGAHDVGLELIVLDDTRVVAVYDLKEWIDELSFHRDTQFCDKVCHLIDGQRLSSIQVEVVEDLSKQIWVVLSQLKNSGFDLGVQHFYRLLCHIAILVLGHLPGGLHHLHEVLVTWRAH